MAEESVRLTVNAPRLVNHLKYAFSNPFSVVTELLQNARRAGATRVDITHRPGEDRAPLIIRDDGRGIDDFQSLFSIGESGWNDETLEAEEGPYGMGFMIVIHSCKEVLIQSNGRAIQVDTERLLKFEDIEVFDDPNAPARGTQIVIRDLNLRDYSIWGCITFGSALSKAVAGFPIDVYHNGVMLERSDAAPAAVSDYSPGGPARSPADPDYNWRSTDVGLMRIPGIDTALESPSMLKELSASHRVRYYLQGLPCGHPGWAATGHHNTLVVHLDPRRFRGVMPDRTTIVDEAGMKVLVDKTVREIWERSLIEIMMRVGGQVFAAVGYRMARRYSCLPLFDHNPWLPPEVLGITADCPHARYQGEDDWAERYSDQPVHRDEFESGRVRATRDAYHTGWDANGDVSWLVSTYLYLHNVCITLDMLSPDHWLNDLLVTCDPSEVGVTLHDQEPAQIFVGDEIPGIPVVRCGGYTLTGPLGPVDGDVPWYWNPDVDEPAAIEGLSLREPAIIFPVGSCETVVLRQTPEMADCADEDDLLDQSEVEEGRFMDFIQYGRSGSADLLRRILDGVGLQSYPGLLGSYAVTISNEPGSVLKPIVTVVPRAPA